jgi:hypothetical protein
MRAKYPVQVDDAVLSTVKVDVADAGAPDAAPTLSAPDASAHTP